MQMSFQSGYVQPKLLHSLIAFKPAKISRIQDKNAVPNTPLSTKQGQIHVSEQLRASFAKSNPVSVRRLQAVLR